MPIRSSRAKPIGPTMVLKKGAWMESLVPRTASATSGKTVPSNTVKAIPTKSRLFSKKVVSLLSRLSEVCRDSSIFSRRNRR